MIVLALIAGFVGGGLSSQSFMTKSASTEKKAPVERIIRAKAFELVDEKGNLCAELKRFGDGSQLRLFDKKGAVLWSSPIEKERQPKRESSTRYKIKQRKQPKKKSFTRDKIKQKTQKKEEILSGHKMETDTLESSTGAFRRHKMETDTVEGTTGY